MNDKIGIWITLIFIILFLIVGIFFYRRKQKKEYIIESLIRDRYVINEILSYITNENLEYELNHLVLYDFFKESAISRLSDILYESFIPKFKKSSLFSITYKKYCDNESLSIAIDNILHGNDVDKKLAELFVNRVYSNIKESEAIENEAIKYHKQFGEEPLGDPELHIQINESETIDQKDIEINDLNNTGTIEDIDS